MKIVIETALCHYCSRRGFPNTGNRSPRALTSLCRDSFGQFRCGECDSASEQRRRHTRWHTEVLYRRRCCYVIVEYNLTLPVKY